MYIYIYICIRMHIVVASFFGNPSFGGSAVYPFGEVPPGGRASLGISGARSLGMLSRIDGRVDVHFG